MSEEKSGYTAEDFHADITLIEEIFCEEKSFHCPVCRTFSKDGSWELIKSDCLLIVQVSHTAILDGGGEGKAEHSLIYIGSNGNTSMHDGLKKKDAKQFKAYDYVSF